MPWAIEKVCSLWSEWKVVHMFINSTLLIMLFRSSLSLLNFCPLNLFCPESGVLKSPILTVLLFLTPCNFHSFYFIKFVAYYLVIFLNVSSFCIVAFRIKNCPSFVMSFCFGTWIYCSFSVSILLFPFVWYTFVPLFIGFLNQLEVCFLRVVFCSVSEIENCPFLLIR